MLQLFWMACVLFQHSSLFPPTQRALHLAATLCKYSMLKVCCWCCRPRACMQCWWLMRQDLRTSVKAEPAGDAPL